MFSVKSGHFFCFKAKELEEQPQKTYTRGQEDNRQLRQSKGSILIETALFAAAFIDNEVFN